MRIPVLVHGRVRGGQEWGRQGRPAKPAGPSSWKRRYHRQVVIAEIPISAATWAAEGPVVMRSIRMRRPAGVSGALAWDMGDPRDRAGI